MINLSGNVIDWNKIGVTTDGDIDEAQKRRNWLVIWLVCRDVEEFPYNLKQRVLSSSRGLSRLNRLAVGKAIKLVVDKGNKRIDFYIEIIVREHTKRDRISN